MKLSVVVPAYNQADPLERCLRSLAAQTLPEAGYEVVVVDDGSTDRTPEVLAGVRDRVRSVRLPRNRGRSAARNAGIEAARGPLVVFVDSDVEVAPRFLDAHLGAHEAGDGRVLSRGPVILVPEPPRDLSAPPPRLTYSPALLDTANAGIRRELLDRAGRFDEGFPGYGWEDFDLGMRLRALGARRVFVREAVAYHVHPRAQWGEVGPLLRKEEERAASAVYFWRKRPTWETRLLIQATPVHYALYWILAGFGALTPQNIGEVVRYLTERRLDALAFAALRGALNRHYVQSLRRHLAARAAAA